MSSIHSYNHQPSGCNIISQLSGDQCLLCANLGASTLPTINCPAEYPSWNFEKGYPYKFGLMVYFKDMHLLRSGSTLSANTSIDLTLPVINSGQHQVEYLYNISFGNVSLAS